MIKNYIFKFIICAAILLLTACSKKDDDNCQIGSPSISSEQIELLSSYIEFYIIENAVLHNDGFYFVIEAQGNRKTPTGCSEVVVNYSGQLYDGKEFDRANNVLFNLEQLIPGWRLGLPLIKEGGIITLYLPAELGYGSKGVENLIPSNSVTIFKIELLKVY